MWPLCHSHVLAGMAELATGGAGSNIWTMCRSSKGGSRVATTVGLTGLYTAKVPDATDAMVWKLTRPVQLLTRLVSPCDAYVSSRDWLAR